MEIVQNLIFRGKIPKNVIKGTEQIECPPVRRNKKSNSELDEIIRRYNQLCKQVQSGKPDKDELNEAKELVKKMKEKRLFIKSSRC